jgi:hypothetical protein
VILVLLQPGAIVLPDVIRPAGDFGEFSSCYTSFRPNRFEENAVGRLGEFMAMALAEARRAVKKILRGLRVLNKDWRIHVGKVLP